MKSSQRLVWIALVIAALLAVAWAGNRYYVPTYTPSTMTTFSSTMRTHCIGRYLIDLPEDMGEPSVYLAQFYYGLDRDFNKVEATMPQGEAMAFDEFRRRATARMKELQNEKNSAMDIPLLLHSEIVSTPNGDAVLFRYLSNSNHRVSAITTQVHAYVNDRYIVLQAKSYLTEGAPVPMDEDHYKLIDPKPAEARLKHMVQHLRAVPDPLRAGEGFCMNGIVFDAQRIGYDEEKADFRFALGPRPSLLRFDASMDGKTGQDKRTLHEQADHEEAIFRKYAEFGVTDSTIRRSERRLAGMRFQESGSQVYFSKTSAAQFRFSARNVQEASELSWIRPAISMTLNSGQFGDEKSRSPLARHQVEAAWDQWTSTLRLSPGNGGATR